MANHIKFDCLVANQKLKQMVADQQEAEKRKVMSQELHKDLQAQQKKISQKQAEVMADLAKVEPAVQEAQLGQSPHEYFVCPQIENCE